MPRRLLLLLFLGLIVLLSAATLLSIQRSLSYGDTVTGTLDDANFFDDFSFDSPEGDVISIAMKRLSGDLNPGIRLYNSDGDAIAHHDNGGNTPNAVLSNFRIPSAGTYYIHALRNAAAESGKYELTLTSIQSIKVNSLCSLQDAISAANRDQAVVKCPAGNGNDIIVLMADTQLQAELPPITSTIMLSGGESTISGGGRFRIFHVEKSASLSIDKLILADGRAEYVNLDGYILGDGGAIINWGDLHISNATFRDNSAAFAGGAIVNFSEVSISNSLFHGNSASESAGAIINYIGGKITIIDSAFRDNSASYSGGAIFNNGELGITGSRFSGNAAELGFGGAIANNIEASITGSRFSGNAAKGDGGAIGNWGDLDITNSQFSGNAAKDDGGAVASWGLLRITSSGFSGNSAGDGGGAIDNNGELRITSSDFSDNSARAGGGAIDNIIDDNFSIHDSSFSNNSPVDLYPHPDD